MPEQTREPVWLRLRPRARLRAGVPLRLPMRLLLRARQAEPGL